VRARRAGIARLLRERRLRRTAERSRRHHQQHRFDIDGLDLELDVQHHHLELDVHALDHDDDHHRDDDDAVGAGGQIRLANGKISIPVTSVVLPARLVIDSVHFTPGVVTSRRAPVSVRVHVSDTRGFWVRGALVFVRSTPLVTSTPPEQVTNQSGFATLTMSPRATFPLRHGYHVQFFLRTRKEGDSLLSGVSSRRLAQVATR
jgi:hypothetical protein